MAFSGSTCFDAVVLSGAGVGGGSLVYANTLTESLLDLDTPTATAALHELRARGIRIAIDDFGTGYSSLSRIQTLPTDLLKLDRSFIATIAADSPRPPLLRAIALLSIALGLPVIAEGVEDAYQADTVKSLGYSFAQGFYYGRPQSRSAILAALADTPTAGELTGPSG
jgi:EAL domain-containing protein (putative c-di-GMP-specific phosphodiesterase class I)